MLHKYQMGCVDHILNLVHQLDSFHRQLRSFWSNEIYLEIFLIKLTQKFVLKENKQVAKLFGEKICAVFDLGLTFSVCHGWNPSIFIGLLK